MERILTVAICLLCVFVSAESAANIWQSTNIHGQRVQNAAKYASLRINDQSNSYFYVKLIHIHSAEIKILAGIYYNITFDVGVTICRKNELTEDFSGNCHLNRNSIIERCWATVWELPSLNRIHLLQDWCYPFMSYSSYFSDLAEEENTHF